MINDFKKSRWTNTLLAVVIIAVIALVSLTGCNKLTEGENTPSNNPAESPVTPNLPEDSSGTTPAADGSEDDSANSEEGTQDNTADDNTSGDMEEQKEYYGQWTVEKVLAYGQAGTYSSEDAEKLVGRSLSFFDDEAVIINDRPADSPLAVKNPEYQEAVTSAGDFAADFRMTFDQLGITEDSVTVVSVNASDTAGGCLLLIKDSNNVILAAGGTYFELVKP